MSTIHLWISAIALFVVIILIVGIWNYILYYNIFWIYSKSNFSYKEYYWKYLECSLFMFILYIKNAIGEIWHWKPNTCNSVITWNCFVLCITHQILRHFMLLRRKKQHCGRLDVMFYAVLMPKHVYAVLLPKHVLDVTNFERLGLPYSVILYSFWVLTLSYYIKCVSLHWPWQQQASEPLSAHWGHSWRSAGLLLIVFFQWWVTDKQTTVLPLTFQFFFLYSFIFSHFTIVIFTNP